jgi:hypothetical protein
MMTETATANLPPTTASARATQTIFNPPPPGAGGFITFLADARVVHDPAVAGPHQPGFAVAISNDPIDFGLLDNSIPGIVDVTIGQGLSLQASAPGDFARALYMVGTSVAGPLVSFELAVDFLTTSLLDVGLTILDFNPAIGFPTESAFASHLRSFLTFDPVLHELSARSDIPLYQLYLAAGSSPVELTYNASAIAGAVPEPTGLVLFALGLAGIAISKRKRFIGVA